MILLRIAVVFVLFLVGLPAFAAIEEAGLIMDERQITDRPQGHILTNIGVWSPDSRWIVYDTRSDAAGEVFDGSRIERVNIESGAIDQVFESKNEAKCGVVTYSPNSDRVVFIHGPENPSAQWLYSAFHRRGVLVKTNGSGLSVNLDARELTAPFKQGALRGGTHVHTFHGRGDWVAFTYEDHVLATSTNDLASTNQRNVGVSVLGNAVSVSDSHPRNHSGSAFTVLVTRTVDTPTPGTDEISRAFSDAWVGRNGYIKANGKRQTRAIAFQGIVTTLAGETASEVFIVDIPEDVTVAGPLGPLQGTTSARPAPPAGTIQRRLSFTSDRKFPGIQGPRHWLRSSPDGSMIAFLMKDENGIVQIFTVSPNGGPLRQISKNETSIESAFSWDPNGRFVAHMMDQQVCVTVVATGETIRLTKPSRHRLRPEACVISPNGCHVAYVRRVKTDDEEFNQIFIATIPKELR